MIVFQVGDTPESEAIFRDDLWRKLQRLLPPEDIYITWPDGRSIKLSVEWDKP